MGRGTYESNFNGKGLTFIVDGMISDLEESYQSYNNDIEEVEKSLSYEEYAEDQYMQRYDDLVSVVMSGAHKFFVEVQQSLNSVGDHVIKRATSDNRQAEFDNSFRCVFDFDNNVEVGILEWENDYIVGVSLSNEPLDEIPINLVLEHGLCAEDYKNRQVMLADSLARYLRNYISEKGFDSRYKTSGYTSRLYDTENTKSEMRKAVKDFSELYESQKSPEETLADNFARNPQKATARILTKDLLYKGEWNYNDDAKYANYVVYDHNSNQIVLLDGDFDVAEETGIQVEDPQRLLFGDTVLGYGVLDLQNQENVEIISSLQRSAKCRILITPQAFEKAFERNLFEEIRDLHDVDPSLSMK